MSRDDAIKALALREIERNLSMWTVQVAKEVIKPNPDETGYDNTGFLSFGYEQIKVYEYLIDLVTADV